MEGFYSNLSPSPSVNLVKNKKTYISPSQRIFSLQVLQSIQNHCTQANLAVDLNLSNAKRPAVTKCPSLCTSPRLCYSNASISNGTTMENSLDDKSSFTLYENTILRWNNSDLPWLKHDIPTPEEFLTVQSKRQEARNAIENLSALIASLCDELTQQQQHGIVNSENDSSVTEKVDMTKGSKAFSPTSLLLAMSEKSDSAGCPRASAEGFHKKEMQLDDAIRQLLGTAQQLGNEIRSFIGTSNDICQYKESHNGSLNHLYENWIEIGIRKKRLVAETKATFIASEQTIQKMYEALLDLENVPHVLPIQLVSDPEFWNFIVNQFMKEVMRDHSLVPPTSNKSSETTIDCSSIQDASSDNAERCLDSINHNYIPIPKFLDVESPHSATSDCCAPIENCRPSNSALELGLEGLVHLVSDLTVHTDKNLLDKILRRFEENRSLRETQRTAESRLLQVQARVESLVSERLQKDSEIKSRAIGPRVSQLKTDTKAALMKSSSNQSEIIQLRNVVEKMKRNLSIVSPQISSLKSTVDDIANKEATLIELRNELSSLSSEMTLLSKQANNLLIETRGSEILSNFSSRENVSSSFRDSSALSEVKIESIRNEEASKSIHESSVTNRSQSDNLATPSKRIQIADPLLDFECCASDNNSHSLPYSSLLNNDTRKRKMPLLDLLGPEEDSNDEEGNLRESGVIVKEVSKKKISPVLDVNHTTIKDSVSFESVALGGASSEIQCLIGENNVATIDICPGHLDSWPNNSNNVSMSQTKDLLVKAAFKKEANGGGSETDDLRNDIVQNQKLYSERDMQHYTQMAEQLNLQNSQNSGSAIYKSESARETSGVSDGTHNCRRGVLSSRSWRCSLYDSKRFPAFSKPNSIDLPYRNFLRPSKPQLQVQSSSSNQELLKRALSSDVSSNKNPDLPKAITSQLFAFNWPGSHRLGAQRRRESCPSFGERFRNPKAVNGPLHQSNVMKIGSLYSVPGKHNKERGACISRKYRGRRVTRESKSQWLLDLSQEALELTFNIYQNRNSRSQPVSFSHQGYRDEVKKENTCSSRPTNECNITTVKWVLKDEDSDCPNSSYNMSPQQQINGSCRRLTRDSCKTNCESRLSKNSKRWNGFQDEPDIDELYDKLHVRGRSATIFVRSKSFSNK